MGSNGGMMKLKLTLILLALGLTGMTFQNCARSSTFAATAKASSNAPATAAEVVNTTMNQETTAASASEHCSQVVKGHFYAGHSYSVPQTIICNGKTATLEFIWFDIANHEGTRYYDSSCTQVHDIYVGHSASM